jgi:hypothetical protein
MRELVPGIFHWSAFHPRIRQPVSSYFVEPAATVIDPMLPEQGLEWFEAKREPERVILTNRHHYRQSGDLVARFGCPVLCNEAGLHEFEGDERVVEGFAPGSEPAPGITAIEVGAICPDETALHIAAGDGAVTLADAAVRGSHGELGFMPDFLLGDDPRAVRDGLRAAFLRVCEEHEFDSLLLAHGDPIATGARSALRAFAESPTAGAPPA